MTKLYKPLFSDKAQGTLGGTLTYRDQKYGPSVGVRHRYVPQPSASQATQRNKFKSACADWQALTSTEKQAYHDDAPSGLNGFQYYISLNAVSSLADRYQYSKTITIDSTVIDSLLSWFPLAVPLSESAGLTAADLSDIFNEVGDDYLKIAIGIGNSEEQLFIEVEQWDAANKRALLWVSRNTFEINPDSDTTLTFCYDASADDNTTFVGRAGVTQVWNNDFAAVYTMAQDPNGGADCIIDSTGNGNHGTPNGNMVSADLVDGVIGKGLNFDGSDDYIDCGSDSSIDVDGKSLGYIAHIKPSAFSGANEFYLGKGDQGVRKVLHAGFRNSTIWAALGFYGADLDITHSFNTDVWYHLAGTYDQATQRGYINGSQEGSTPNSALSGSDNYPLLIGRGGASLTSSLNCIISFFALFAGNFPSSDWIKADYHAQTDNLLTWGATG